MSFQRALVPVNRRARGRSERTWGLGMVLVVAAGSAVGSAVLWVLLLRLIPQCPSQAMTGMGLAVGCSVRWASGADPRMGPVAAVFCIFGCVLTRVLIFSPLLLTLLLPGEQASDVVGFLTQLVLVSPGDFGSYLLAGGLAWLCVAGRADRGPFGNARVRVRR